MYCFRKLQVGDPAVFLQNTQDARVDPVDAPVCDNRR
jgi:hypothetical protein